MTGRLARRAFLAGGPLVVLSACVAGQKPLSAYDRTAVERVQSWLDNLHGLRARFLQTWPDNAVSEGVALFDPPGRLRLDYAPNDRMVLVANGGHIVVTDAGNGSVTRLPARSSALGLLLDGRIDLLGGGVRVTDVQQNSGRVQLTLDRADNPGAGQLTLLFDDKLAGGLVLTDLQAVDAERRRTDFRLFDQTTGAPIPPAAFILPS